MKNLLLPFVLALTFPACSGPEKERVVIDGEIYMLSAESVETLRERMRWMWVRLDNYEEQGSALISRKEVGQLSLLEVHAKIATLQAWAKTLKADKDMRDKMREGGR